MKCQSYFPVYHPHYDLNVDANGGTSPMYNGNATFRSGHYNEYVAPLPLPRGPPFAYKELLRQTMILHEDTFKGQVQELHRLYRRQKELMDEIKRNEISMNHLHIEDQSSNSSSAKYDQNTLHNNISFFKSHFTPSTRRDNIQTSLCSLKESKPLEFEESKVKKIGGKLLDLELPAEVYIDSDEEESLQATPPTIFSPQKRAKVVIESDVKSYVANRSLNSVLQGEVLSPCLSSRIDTNLADLNESLTSCLEESGGDKGTNSRVEILEINHDLSYSENSTPDSALAQSEKAKSEEGLVGSGPDPARKPAFILGQNTSVIQALPSLNSELSSTRGARISARKKLLKRADVNQSCSPNSRVTRSSKNSSVSSKKNLDSYLIDLNSIANSSPESTPSSSKISPEGEAMNKSKRFRMIDINLPCDLTTDYDPHDYENSDEPNTENICLNGEEINLEASITQEIEIAAKAIVSLSSSQSRSKSSNPELNILHKCDTLEWFAGIVSSLSVNTCDIVDDYEAMTLNLTEMKLDEYYCKNTINVQISSETYSMLPSQTRKGRTRRSKRKDFQKEVLPSLASLSRYEVTEDIQLIEGLMDAAGTPWQLSKMRRASRMGRKPRVAKQQTSNDELMAVMRWGKVNRRSNGRRNRASSTILLKWVECVI